MTTVTLCPAKSACPLLLSSSSTNVGIHFIVDSLVYYLCCFVYTYRLIVVMYISDVCTGRCACLFVCLFVFVCVCVCVCVCVWNEHRSQFSWLWGWDLLRVDILCECRTAQHSVLMNCHIFLGYISAMEDIIRRRKAVSKFNKTFNILIA